MVRDGHRHSAGGGSPLRDHIAAALADERESMLLEYTTGVSPGEDAELTHAPLQSG